MYKSHCTNVLAGIDNYKNGYKPVKYFTLVRAVMPQRKNISIQIQFL